MPVFGASGKQIESFTISVQEYFRQVDREAMYCMQLVSESAFMAESFLNLLYAVLMRPVIRDSKDLRDEALLRQWKSKVRHLPADCSHIVGTPEMGDRRIRDAKWLFDLRNRIAHSYPDKEHMRVGQMWFFESFPVFRNAANVLTLDHALNNQLPSRDDALRAIVVAEGFVEYLRGLVNMDAVPMIDMIAAAQPLGFNEAKNIYGIPFGRYSAFALFADPSERSHGAGIQPFSQPSE